MTTTNFPNGLSSFGVPVLSGMPLPFTGNYFFVNPLIGADGNDATPEQPLATLAGALARCVSGHNDVVLLIGDGQSDASARLSATLAWNKDATHLIGIAAPTMNFQRARIAPLAGAAVFTPMVKITGDGCMFYNVSTFYGFANASAQVNWLDEGERNYYNNINFGGFGDALAAAHIGSRSLVLGAAGTGRGEHTFDNCAFGIDTVARGAANYTVEIIGGSPRIVMRNCLWNLNSSADAARHMLIGAGGIDRYLWVQGGLQNNFGTNMTVGNNIDAAPGGNVIMNLDAYTGATQIATTGRITSGRPNAGNAGGKVLANA